MTSFLRPFAETDDAARRRSQSLAALAVTLGLVVISFYLIQHLRAEAALQDCILSGHAWCAAASQSF